MRLKRKAPKGVSSRVEEDGTGHRQRQSEEVFLYDGPFKILNHAEHMIYEKLVKMDVSNPRALDWGAYRDLGIDSKVKEYLTTLNLIKYAELNLDAYTNLTLEFYSTFQLINERKVVTCRLAGKEIRIDNKLMKQLFGFNSTGAERRPMDFDLDDAWHEISGCPTRHGDPVNGHIKDHALCVVHKFICYNVFGKKEGHKVSRDEMFFLSCALRKKPVCPLAFIWTTIDSVRTSKRFSPSFGHLITALALHFKLNVGEDPVRCRYLDIHELTGASIAIDEDTLFPHSERQCVRNYFVGHRQRTGASTDVPQAAPVQIPPYVPRPQNPWEAFSAQLLAMRSFLEDQFAAVNSRLDSLDSRLVKLETSRSTRPSSPSLQDTPIDPQ